MIYTCDLLRQNEQKKKKSKYLSILSSSDKNYLWGNVKHTCKNLKRLIGFTMRIIDTHAHNNRANWNPLRLEYNRWEWKEWWIILLAPMETTLVLCLQLFLIIIFILFLQWNINYYVFFSIKLLVSGVWIFSPTILIIEY